VNVPDLKQLRSEYAEERDRMRRARAGHSDAMAATQRSLSQSHELLTEADAMLSKGDKTFLEAYFRDRKG
jgi:hypothetical protein